MNARFRILTSFLMIAGLFAFTANQQAMGFELLDRLLGTSAGGCGCETSCCEVSCDNQCGCEPACGCETECGCEPALLCDTSCGCEPVCGCDSTCGCEATCGCESKCNCCACKRGPLAKVLDLLRSLRPRGCSCCEQASCGCESNCCDVCGCGVDNEAMETEMDLPNVVPLEDEETPTPPA